MSQLFKSSVIFLFISIFSNALHAGPWFTGPILAPAGHTIPNGHTNFEIYEIDLMNNGFFTNTGHSKHTPLFTSYVTNPILTHGFTDWLDIQLAVPYLVNSTRGVSYNRLADVSLTAGFQLVEQKDSAWRPNVRIIVQETFPTGKFDELNPAFLGTDATGLGSYRTQIGINFQHLAEVFNDHYLRSRFIISRQYSGAVSVVGINSFGGTPNTEGTVRPGTEDNFDLAFEFTMTQHWVAVMEGYISEGKETRFNGILDIVDDGTSSIGRSDYYEIGLAPAIEYNFNANVGIIGGVWFPVQGKNTANFTNYVLALNAYW